MVVCLGCVLLALVGSTLAAEEPWESALAHMPLTTPVTQINKTNCVNVVLDAFQANATVKALIFLPAAVDELYFFDRVHANLAVATPTLLDAIAALTNQTRIRATFRAGHVLLHTAEESSAPWSRIAHAATAERLSQRQIPGCTDLRDANWDRLQPILRRSLSVRVQPGVDAPDSWHFYRANFRGWDLNGQEMLEAVSLATRTRFTVRWRKAVFERVSWREVLERRGGP